MLISVRSYATCLSHLFVMGHDPVSGMLSFVASAYHGPCHLNACLSASAPGKYDEI